MNDIKIVHKIENYLINYGHHYDLLSDNIWIVHDDDIDIVIMYDGTSMIFRIRLMEVPTKNREKFFERLLILNSTLIYGAYSIEDNHIVIIDCIEALNLDENEFQASIESISMAVRNDYKELSTYLN